MKERHWLQVSSLKATHIISKHLLWLNILPWPKYKRLQKSLCSFLYNLFTHNKNPFIWACSAFAQRACCNKSFKKPEHWNIKVRETLSMLVVRPALKPEIFHSITFWHTGMAFKVVKYRPEFSNHLTFFPSFFFLPQSSGPPRWFFTSDYIQLNIGTCFSVTTAGRVVFYTPLLSIHFMTNLTLRYKTHFKIRERTLHLTKQSVFLPFCIVVYLWHVISNTL